MGGSRVFTNSRSILKQDNHRKRNSIFSLMLIRTMFDHVHHKKKIRLKAGIMCKTDYEREHTSRNFVGAMGSGTAACHVEGTASKSNIAGG